MLHAPSFHVWSVHFTSFPLHLIDLESCISLCTVTVCELLVQLPHIGRLYNRDSDTSSTQYRSSRSSSSPSVSLFTHRSSKWQADIFHRAESPEDVMIKMKDLPMSTEIRRRFQYNNQSFINKDCLGRTKSIGTWREDAALGLAGWAGLTSTANDMVSSAQYIHTVTVPARASC